MKALFLLLLATVVGSFASHVPNQLGHAPKGYPSLTAVSFSATPTFDLSQGTAFKITLTGNVTSSTFSSGDDGVIYTIQICQDATGLRTFSWPANVKGEMVIGSVASTCSLQQFLWDNGDLKAIGSGITGL